MNYTNELVHNEGSPDAMPAKFFDGELHVMNVLWQEGDKTAKQISEILEKKIGWNINTTYTMIKRCIAKGAIQRSEPHFMCHALITQEEARAGGVSDLVNRLFDGSTELLFATLLNWKSLDTDEIERLRELIGREEDPK